jgi:hypothetical protein
VGLDPCANYWEPEVHGGPPAQDGVNLGTAVRALPEGERSSDGVEPGHTTRPTNRSKSAHAVEFSKTVAPLQEADPPQGARPDPKAGSGADR